MLPNLSHRKYKYLLLSSLFTSSISTSYQCGPCRCSVRGRRDTVVYCQNKNLKKLPKELPKNATVLNLQVSLECIVHKFLNSQHPLFGSIYEKIEIINNSELGNYRGINFRQIFQIIFGLSMFTELFYACDSYKS